MAAAAPTALTPRRRIYDLLPPDVQRAYPVNTLTRGYRAVVERPVPEGMPPGLEAALGRRLAQVLPQATVVAAIRRKYDRALVEEQAAIPGRVREEAYQRQSPAMKFALRFGAGAREAAPSLAKAPGPSQLPPPTREYEKLAEGAGGLTGFMAVATPVTLATGGLGTPALVAGAAGAGLAAAAPAGTIPERLVRGGVTAALSPVAEVTGGLVGRKASGAVAKAVARYAAQPAVTGATFGTLQPWVENKVREGFGMEAHPFTLREAMEGGVRLAALSAVMHGAQDSYGRTARGARPPGAPPAAAPAPAAPGSPRALVDRFLAPPPGLAPAQVVEATRVSDAVSTKLAGREFTVDAGGLEPARVRVVRVNIFPGRVAVLAEDVASGTVVPLVYENIVEMNRAILPREAPGSAPAAAPEARVPTPGEVVRPTTMREQISGQRRTEQVVRLRNVSLELEQRIAAEPGNKKRGQWQNKLARVRATLARLGGGGEEHTETSTTTAPSRAPAPSSVAGAMGSKARGKGEESPSTPPPTTGAPTPRVTAPAGALTTPQETAGAPNTIARSDGSRVRPDRMQRGHLFNSLIRAMRTPAEQRTPEHENTIRLGKEEVRRRGLEEEFKQHVIQRGERERARAEAEGKKAASERQGTLEPVEQPREEAQKPTGQEVVPPPATAAASGESRPAPSVLPDIKEFAVKPRGDFVKPKSGSEEDLDAASRENRNRMTGPAEWKRAPVGTWAKDKDGDLWELVELDANDPRINVTESPAKHQVALYADWARKSGEVPPLKMIETEKGGLNISDGTHRLMAAREAGMGKVQAWVARTVAEEGKMPRGMRETDERKPFPREAPKPAPERKFKQGDKVVVPYTGRGRKKIKRGYREHGEVVGYVTDSQGKERVLVNVRRGKKTLVTVEHGEHLITRQIPSAKVRIDHDKRMAAARQAAEAAVGGSVERADALYRALRSRYEKARASYEAGGDLDDKARYGRHRQMQTAELAMDAAKRVRDDLAEAAAEASAEPPAPKPSAALAEAAGKHPKHFDEGRVREIEELRSDASMSDSDHEARRFVEYDRAVQDATGGDAFGGAHPVRAASLHDAVGRLTRTHAAVLHMKDDLTALVKKAQAAADPVLARAARSTIGILRGEAERLDALNAAYGPAKVAERLARAEKEGRPLVDELYAIKQDLERDFPPSDADHLPPDLKAPPWGLNERGFVRSDVLGVALFRDALRGVGAALKRLRREQGNRGDLRIRDPRGNTLRRIAEVTERDEFKAAAFSRLMALTRLAGGEVALPKDIVARNQLSESAEALGISKDALGLLEGFGTDAARAVMMFSSGGIEAYRFIESGGKEGRLDHTQVGDVTRQLFKRMIEQENALRVEMGLKPIKAAKDYITRLTRGDYPESLPPAFLETLMGRPVSEAEARDLSMRFHEHREDYPVYEKDLMTALLARIVSHHRFMTKAPVVRAINEWLTTEGTKSENLHQARLVRAWTQATFFEKPSRGTGWFDNVVRRFTLASRLDAPRELSPEAAAKMLGTTVADLNQKIGPELMELAKKQAPSKPLKARFFIAHPDVKVSENAKRLGLTRDGKDAIYYTTSGVAHGLNALQAHKMFQKFGITYLDRVMATKFKAAGIKVEPAERRLMAERKFNASLRDFDQHPLQAFFQFFGMQQLRALLGWNSRAMFQNSGNNWLTTLPEIMAMYGPVKGSRAWAEGVGTRAALGARGAARWLGVGVTDALAKHGYISEARARQYREAFPVVTGEMLAEGIGSLQGEARRATESMRHVLDNPRSMLGDMYDALGPLKGYQFVEDVTRGADALAWVIAGQRAGMKPLDIWKSWGSASDARLKAWEHILEQASDKDTATRHAMEMSLRTMFDYGALGRSMLLSNPIARTLFRLTTFPLNYLRKYEARPISAVLATGKALASGALPDAYTRYGLRLMVYQMAAAGALLEAGARTGINFAVFGIPGYVQMMLGWLKDMVPGDKLKEWYQMAQRGAVIQYGRGPTGFAGPTVGAAIEAMKSGDYVGSEAAFEKRHATDPLRAKAVARLTEQMWPMLRGVVLMYTVPGLIQLKRTSQVTRTLAPLRKPLGVRSYLDPEKATLADRIKFQTGTMTPKRQAELQQRTNQKPRGAGRLRLRPRRPLGGGREAFGTL